MHTSFFILQMATIMEVHMSKFVLNILWTLSQLAQNQPNCLLPIAALPPPATLPINFKLVVHFAPLELVGTFIVVVHRTCTGRP
ncbi:uncharacterized protein LACBIDRAFT_314479 [Laccaria bicolor S238N-H82]|uniref:Predicted protein n=1 Tax=Laccaria bicolor (strain S238N-H82 / ATCC MYA-4686) TaxID=486041 RepID=B0DYM9_LACBS|nr:uncharacterized protein LACBIDRAFT_314479 [Laccaria bicolor S238N-H82]EDR00275.1 predicted protein [Laccaria bicolor S238N-H82]|eukprot:XP_001889027.1 predicted protein [Laccaria bicolor S238N-H82]